jgi:response regulator RpfG family c-di-GMP phosphodiesterase
MDKKSIISIYLSNKENLKILEESLHHNYVIKIDAPFNIQTDTDLIIIDGVFLNQNEHFIQVQKNLQYPVFLPVLLLTTRQDIGVATSSLWKNIDDVIIMPINKTVLFARIALCLKTRQLSIENQNISEKKYQEILESINDIFFVLDDNLKLGLMFMDFFSVS